MNKRLIPLHLNTTDTYVCSTFCLKPTLSSLHINTTSFPSHTHFFFFLFWYPSLNFSFEFFTFQKVGFPFDQRQWKEILFTFSPLIPSSKLSINLWGVEGIHHLPLLHHSEWMNSHPMRVHNYSHPSFSLWSTSSRFWMRRPQHNWNERIFFFCS